MAGGRRDREGNEGGRASTRNEGIGGKGKREGEKKGGIRRD